MSSNESIMLLGWMAVLIILVASMYFTLPKKKNDKYDETSCDGCLCKNCEKRTDNLCTHRCDICEEYFFAIVKTQSCEVYKKNDE